VSDVFWKKMLEINGSATVAIGAAWIILFAICKRKFSGK